MSNKSANMKGPQNIVHPVPPAAGDNGDHSEAESEDPMPIYPENIHKRLNALKNIHIDIQKLEQEMHMRMFQVEAELHKKMEPLLKKRSEIVAGTYEPNEKETSFKLRDSEPQPETIPSNGESGIPKFWLTVLQSTMAASSFMETHDEEVLGYLRDIRTVYMDSPLGFTVEFEFAENPFFSNQVLSRTYVFDDNIPREDLYLNSGLSPKTTSGTHIEWKEGKDVTKKVVTSFQRNKKTNERRQIKNETDQDSFFKFFMPEITDLATLMKPQEPPADPENPTAEDDENVAQINQAEMEYEFASSLRTHVIPRALLIFTQEDEDEDFGDEDDFDDEEDDDDEGEESDEEGQGDQEEEESDDEPVGKGGKKGGHGIGNGRPGGIGKAGKMGKH